MAVTYPTFARCVQLQAYGTCFNQLTRRRTFGSCAFVGFSYWRGRKAVEVDIVAAVQGRLVPFEICTPADVMGE
jgi:hypothetical protein